MFRRPQRAQTCISAVSNNGIKRVALAGEGRTLPEYTYLNWEFEQGEEVKEGEHYRVVILPDHPRGNIMKRIILAIAILLVATAAQARPHHHHRHHHHHAHRHATAQPGPSGRPGRVCTKTGHCAR